MNKQVKSIAWACLIGLFTFNSCKKPQTSDPTPPVTNNTNDFLKTLRTTQTSAVIPAPQTVGSPIVEWNGTTYCTTTKYRVGPQFSEGFLLNPQADVIFPGAILDGNSIGDGSYKLITLPRTNGTISTDLMNTSTASTSVDEVVKSKVQQGLIDLLSKQLSGSSAGAQINFEVQDIYSDKQVDMNLGFTYGAANKTKIKGGFDFSQKTKKSRVMVKFQQIYYTVSFDPKTKPADYFQSSVTLDDLKKAIGNSSTTPVYVANVKYGRLAYYTFESDMTQEKLKATIDAQFTLFKNEATVKATYKDSLNSKNTKITGVIIGGSGADAVQAVTGIDGFYQYILNGGNYSASSPGLPIAYTLRNVSDNNVYSVVNYSDYQINNCYNTTGKVTLNAAKHISGSQDDNIWGNISVNLGYDSDAGFSNSASNLWSVPNAGNSVTFPSNGNITSLATSPYNLSYDPTKFNEAFLEITLNLNNKRDYTVGVENHSGSAVDVINNKKIKLYLKDIKAQKLGSDWAVNNSQSSKTWDLIVKMDGESKSVNGICLSKNWLGSCTYGNVDVSKEASTIYFNFSLNLDN